MYKMAEKYCQKFQSPESGTQPLQTTRQSCFLRDYSPVSQHNNDILYQIIAVAAADLRMQYQVLITTNWTRIASRYQATSLHIHK